MKQKRNIIMFLSILLCGLLVCLPEGFSSEPISRHTRIRKDKHIQTKEFLSSVYHINKIYKSMEGPSSIEKITLMNSDPPELIWITGYRTVVVDGDGKTPVDQQYMCHNNLEYDVQKHAQIFWMV